MASSRNRSTEAVRVWMPLGSMAAAITLVIAFVMGVPQQQTIAASALAGILVFSGFLFRSFGKDKDKYDH
jgi:hypothetical protein